MTYNKEWNEEWVEDQKDENYMYRVLAGPYCTVITAEEFENFNSLKINKKKSYVVRGNSRKVLQKFMFAYILNFYPEIRDFYNKFESHNFKTHFDIIINGSSFIVPIDKVLVLYHDRMYNNEGGRGRYNFERIATEISKRNRDGEVSLILSEKPILAPIKDSNKNFNLIEYLDDEVTSIYLNNDLSLGTEAEIDGSVPTIHSSSSAPKTRSSSSASGKGKEWQ